MLSCRLLLVVLVGLAVAQPGRAAPKKSRAAETVAAEKDAPIVEHSPEKRLPAGAKLVIRARILSPLGNTVMPTLYVKVPGLQSFASVEMKSVPRVADVFAAEVPPELTDQVVDYYLEAFDSDGNGPGRSGSPERPHRVGIGVDAPPLPPPPEPAAPSAAPVAPTTTPEPPSVPAEALAGDTLPVTGAPSMITYTIAGAGAASLLAGAVLTGLALATAGGDQVSQVEGRSFHTLTQAQAAAANAQASAGVVLLGVGAALGGVAAAGFVFQW